MLTSKFRSSCNVNNHYLWLLPPHCTCTFHLLTKTSTSLQLLHFLLPLKEASYTLDNSTYIIICIVINHYMLTWRCHVLCVVQIRTRYGPSFSYYTVWLWMFSWWSFVHFYPTQLQSQLWLIYFVFGVIIHWNIMHVILLYIHIIFK